MRFVISILSQGYAKALRRNAPFFLSPFCPRPLVLLLSTFAEPAIDR